MGEWLLSMVFRTFVFMFGLFLVALIKTSIPKTISEIKEEGLIPYVRPLVRELLIWGPWMFFVIFVTNVILSFLGVL